MFRRMILTAALAAVVFPAASGAQPDPVASIVPPALRVVTPRSGPIDPAAIYTVTVFDLAGPPLAGTSVTLDFGACSHVLPAMEQSFPGMTLESCAPPVLSAVTNAAGEANFLVMGSVVSRLAAGTGAGCVVVSAGFPPVVLGTASPAAFDQDGVNGLTANDWSLFLCDLGSAIPYARSDFNGDGTLSAPDAVVWLNEYGAGKEGGRTPERCDGAPATVAQNPAPGGELRLAWGTCATDGGTQTRAFACTSNTGADFLEASFIAPAGVETMTGFEAEVELIGDEGMDLVPWWRVDAAGCRAGSGLILDVGYPTLGEGCPRIPDESAWVGGSVTVYPSTGSSNRARVHIVASMSTPEVPLTAGAEYSAFRLRLSHARTVGGTCPGCSESVAALFRWMRITQTPTADPRCGSPPEPGPRADFLTGDFEIRADATNDAWIAYWQGVPDAFPAVLDAPAAAPVPARLSLACTNPSRGAARVEFGIPQPTRCALAIYDVAGRRRRVLLDAAVVPGSHVLRWDGRDDRGAPMESGYYVLRLATDRGSATRSMIHVR